MINGNDIYFLDAGNANKHLVYCIGQNQVYLWNNIQMIYTVKQIFLWTHTQQKGEQDA